MSKLKFVVKQAGFKKIVEGFLVSDKKDIDLNYDCLEVFNFATRYALNHNITINKKNYMSYGYKVSEYTIDDAIKILDRFNNNFEKLKRKYKLKKDIIRGTIIATAGIIGSTAIIKINSSKYEDSLNVKDVYAIEHDNNTPLAGVTDDISIDNTSVNSSLDIPVATGAIEYDAPIDYADDVTNYDLPKISFNYNDRSFDDRVTLASNYEQYYNYYGHIYGIDPTLIRAVICQESGGVHKEYDGHAAIGAMQVAIINEGSIIKAYNFETGSIDEEEISKDKLNNVSTNIKIGTMMLQSLLDKYNYDIPKAIQAYNFGSGNMAKLGNNWMGSREYIKEGDPLYFEHVMSFISDGDILNIRKRDLSTVSVSVDNQSIIKETSITK